MNTRAVIIRITIVITVLVFSARLFSIQIIDDQYKQAAQNNIIHKVIKYPYRGLITDKYGKLLVHNEPVYDLMVIPKEVNHQDSTRICDLLEITNQEYLDSYNKAKRYSIILPSIFYDKLSNEKFASIQDKIVDVSGYTIQPRTTRSYDHKSLANVLGYVGEVTASQLRADTSNYYRSGDYIGITGVEKYYEQDLRGKRGISYQTVDVRGTVIGEFGDGEFDTLPESGNNIQLTIDLELQQYAEKLMEGKTGSVVAIEPKTGEILAFVSAPSYDPNQFSGRDFSENFSKVQLDSLKPLFNRPIQAMYPPGSMFKTIQSLVALKENRVGTKEEIYCEGDLIGDLAPPGEYDITKAITYSSNNFFYKVFRRVIQQGYDENSFIDARIGYERWRSHVLDFGLGDRLGIDLPNENTGSIPDLNVYDRIYGINRWRFSNIYSLSIGQGELLVTPLQMANLGSILANRGYYYTPHVVRAIGNGTSIPQNRNEVGIDPAYFEVVVDGMEKVISIGSGIRAYIPDLPICGKTSTVENPHGEDHSGFMGFAPKDNPEIAIAVYVENAGWGGRAAGSTASLLIEKHIKGHITRPWTEAYVLKGDFADERPTNESD